MAAKRAVRLITKFEVANKMLIAAAASNLAVAKPRDCLLFIVEGAVVLIARRDKHVRGRKLRRSDVCTTCRIWIAEYKHRGWLTTADNVLNPDLVDQQRSDRSMKSTPSRS